jgi:alpha-glucuronidase
LNHKIIDNKKDITEYRHAISSLTIFGKTKTCSIIQEELRNGLQGMLGKEIALRKSEKSSGLIIGTPSTSVFIKKLISGDQLKTLGEEGYVITSIMDHRKSTIVIAANADKGLLYGAFHLLRLIQTGQKLENLTITSKPRIKF